MIEPALADVARSGNGRGSGVARRLGPIVRAKLDVLATTIGLARGGRRDDAIRLVGMEDSGNRFLDEIRSVVEAERRWTRGQTTRLAENSALMVRQLTFGLIGGLVALVLLTALWLREARTRLAQVDRARARAEAALAALKTENAAREEAEGKVRQLQKMESLGQLTGGIAHDFNNMLAIVLGGIELARKKLTSDPDRAQRYLDNALEGGTRAAALTARLLAFSRNLPLAPTTIDANKLINGMCEMLNRTLGEAIEVECVDSAGLWRCYADAGEVENAILNLAVNARDAMPDGGKLTIETANAHIDDNYARSRTEVEPGQYVVICVTDTGEGMPPDVIERAFDPFFTTKPIGKGTGLGLSQVFGFAKQSGGHVAIYSEPREGTTVKLYLPRFTGADAGDPASAARDENIPQGQSHEIVLVVEDEQRAPPFRGRCAERAWLRDGIRGIGGQGAPFDRREPGNLPAVYRHRHAGNKRPQARRYGVAGEARPEGAVYHRLYPQRGGPQRDARCRGGVPRQALHDRRSGAKGPRRDRRTRGQPGRLTRAG